MLSSGRKVSEELVRYGFWGKCSRTLGGGKQQGLLKRLLGENGVGQTGGRSVASLKTRPAAWPWALAGGPLLQRVIHTCCLTLCDPMAAARQASLSFTVSQSLLKLMTIESVMPSNHLILCCPLLPLPSIFPSIRVQFIIWNNDHAVKQSVLEPTQEVSYLCLSGLWLTWKNG